MLVRKGHWCITHATPSTQTRAREGYSDAGEHFGHGRVDAAIARQDLPGLDVEGAAVEGAHLTAGLAHHQHAGCQIPCVDRVFPVAIEPTARDITQVERGAARAADRLTAHAQRLETT